MKKLVIIILLLLCLSLCVFTFASFGKSGVMSLIKDNPQEENETPATTEYHAAIDLPRTKLEDPSTIALPVETETPASTEYHAAIDLPRTKLEDPSTVAPPVSTATPLATDAPTTTNAFTTVNNAVIVSPFNQDFDVYSAYLNEIGIVPGLSTEEWTSLVGAYRYEGVDILHSPAGGPFFAYELENGGGCEFIGTLFGFSDVFQIQEDGLHAENVRRFYTNTDLDGLTLPFGIVFSDSLATVLQKLSVDLDLQSGFVSDPDQTGTMTLFCEGKTSLKLHDLLLQCDESDLSSGKPLYDYRIEYTEEYCVTLESGREEAVTRRINLSFTDSENNSLGMFDIAISEYFALLQNN